MDDLTWNRVSKPQRVASSEARGGDAGLAFPRLGPVAHSDAARVYLECSSRTREMAQVFCILFYPRAVLGNRLIALDAFLRTLIKSLSENLKNRR